MSWDIYQKLIFCTLSFKRKHPKAQFKDVRVKNKFDEERFKQVLDETPFWAVANIFDDVDDICYTWEKLYKDILNYFTKTRRAKVMTHKQPWIDRELTLSNLGELNQPPPLAVFCL